MVHREARYVRVTFAQIFALGGGKLLRIPLAILFMSLMASALGPTGMGRWAMLLAVTTLFHALLLSWLQASNIRFGREEWTSRRSLSRTWAARWPLIATGFAISVLALAIQPFDLLERFFGLPNTQWPFAVLLLFGQWCSAESQSLYRLKGKVSNLALVPIAVDVATILVVTIMFFAPANERIDWTILSLVLTMTICWGMAWGCEFFNTRSWSGERPAPHALHDTLRYSWPLLPAFFFSYLSNWGDHILLQYFRGPEEVGLFDAAYQVVVALQAFASPFAILLLPRLVDRKLSKADHSAEQDYVTRMLPTLLAIWLIVSVIVLVFVPWLFELIFGPGFAAAGSVILVLSGVVTGAGFTALYAVLFEVQGRLGRSAAMAAGMVIVNFAVSLALIPTLGGTGAAVGTLCANLVVQVLYMQDQHTFLRAARGKSHALFAFSSLYAVLQIMAGPELLARSLLTLVSLVVFAGILRHFRILDEDALVELLPRTWQQAMLPFLRPLCAQPAGKRGTL